MKISELIAVLQRRLKKHGDLEVRYTWEGITVDLEATSVYASKEEPVLFLDAEHDNHYKTVLAKDIEEGEDGT